MPFSLISRIVKFRLNEKLKKAEANGKKQQNPFNRSIRKPDTRRLR